MLTDTNIRRTKPGAKPIKLSDAQGLHLLIKPDGGRYWRLNYRFDGKQKTLALGVYPTVTLADARQRREDARRLLAHGTDPSEAKKAAKEARKAAAVVAAKRQPSGQQNPKDVNTRTLKVGLRRQTCWTRTPA